MLVIQVGDKHVHDGPDPLDFLDTQSFGPFYQLVVLVKIDPQRDEDLVADPGDLF